MGLSKIDIANQALGRISESQIESLDQENESARKVNLYYDQALEEVLRDYNWNSATHRASLVALDEAPVFQYTNAFALPADFIKLIELYDNTGTQDPAIKWVIEGTNLLCDLDEVYIKYVRVDKNTVNYDSLLTSAIINKLATKMAYSKTDSEKMVRSLIEEYEQVILPKATSIDTLDNNDYLSRTESTWLDNRGGGLGIR